jgi:excisionase family DNA binding protein
MTDMARTASTQQVAAALSVTESTVRAYSRDSRIPFGRTTGGHRRYDIDEVRAALGIDDAPTMLTSIRSSGVGAGASFERSAMATLDAKRRAIVGNTPADSTEPVADIRDPQDH